jgi:very-short-patch-repair endonuclease
MLWHQLRKKRVGDVRFRRQFPIGTYIVDFVCLPARLIIEVDGPMHDLTFAADQRRTQWLESRGFKVVRFRNEDVLRNLDGVVAMIEMELAAARSRVSAGRYPSP